jgi:glycosyltransferase involved in cell wall biosynthesis
LKKKILYIITQAEFGGAQRYVFDLATNFSGEFDILVAAGGNGNDELFERLKVSLPSPPFSKGGLGGVKTIHLKHLRRTINPWRDILALLEIRWLIKKEKPDIIHLNSSKAGILGSIAVKIARSNQFKTIYTAHGWVFNEPISRLKKKVYLFLEKWTARYKNKIICVSEYDRQIAIKLGFPAEKLTTIHNGINFGKIDFLSKEDARQQLFDLAKIKEKNNHSDTLIIGTIANLYPTKGIEYLIEAAHIFFQQHENISRTGVMRFIAIGEGKERPKLEKLIKKYRLENNFLLVGHIPNAYKYLKAFDIFVLPSVKEGFPFAILEAGLAGLPIIAARVGGIPEIINDGENGMLTEPKSERELAEKILFCLQNKEHGNIMAEKLKNKISSNFSLANTIQKTRDIYFD